MTEEMYHAHGNAYPEEEMNHELRCPNCQEHAHMVWNTNHLGNRRKRPTCPDSRCAVYFFIDCDHTRFPIVEEEEL